MRWWEQKGQHVQREQREGGRRSIKDDPVFKLVQDGWWLVGQQLSLGIQRWAEQWLKFLRESRSQGKREDADGGRSS